MDNSILRITVLPVLAGVGLLYLSVKIFSFARLLISLFILPGVPLSNFAPRGSWALITGASDGIGKEYAIQLATRGFNVVLVSRTASKLDALARELRLKYSIDTRTISMDIARNREADYLLLRSVIDGLDVSILVNNVGQSHDIPVPFVHTEVQEMTDIITVNCLGTLRITSLIAPGMVQRKRGLILTMASFGGMLPTPLLATYSGSKAFLQQWSTALGSELQPHGVSVQLVQSYLVTSAMSKIRKTSMFVPNPRAFVKSALGKIGRSGGAQGIAYTSTPYWSHGIAHWMLSTFVGTMNHVVLNRNRAMQVGIRNRALRKQERGGKKA